VNQQNVNLFHLPFEQMVLQLQCCKDLCPACHVCFRLTPYLSSLSTSQLKLLTIYYNRTLASNKQQRAMGSSAEQQQFGF
jgi:hypothetical protein